jgi:hypothetical protein
MRHMAGILIRIALFACVFLIWTWIIKLPLTNAANLSVIAGAVIAVFPVVWLARILLDRDPTPPAGPPPWCTPS